MMNPQIKKSTQDPTNGYALVATLTLMSLIIMVVVALISMSSIEIRNSASDVHKEIAKANAQMAMRQAIGQLQKHAGPDQRVTARAAIFENNSQIANRNWLGIWKTTQEYNGAEWPLIGKAPMAGSNNTPYPLRGAYTDLRQINDNLVDDAWRDNLHLEWLVSRRSTSTTHNTSLNVEDTGVVRLVGRGSLGNLMNADDFEANQVLVEKINLSSEGAYAWFISDNNQKASLDPISNSYSNSAPFESAIRFNPALLEIKSVDSSSAPFEDFSEKMKPHVGKIISKSSVSLAFESPDEIKKILDQKYHDITVYSPGLFTNTATGGLKKDLTPLLLAEKGESTLDFQLSSGAANLEFSSAFPIIPGPEHGVLGPCFDALRDWALHTYSSLTVAETAVTESAIRMRPTTDWAHGISDGGSVDIRSWASSAPKIHPFMTESRWHYYFTHQNNRIRTHIIPRVCLWNPYNRSLTIPDMSVLMPNPFYNISHGMHFFPEESHVAELKDKYKSNSSHIFTRWIRKSGYVGGDVYKMRTNPFPKERFLAFTLEATTLEPGECHVFSPKVTSALESSNGINIQVYQPENPSANILSSRSEQGKDHFVYNHDSSVRYQAQAPNWRNLSDSDLNEIDFGRIMDYQPEVVMSSDNKVDSFPFMLKNGTTDVITELYESPDFVTLQLVIANSSGAKSTTYFGYIGERWGSANQQDNSFGYLQTFADAPLKDAPDTHQIGAKLLWLDEGSTEGNAPPLRVTRWANTHMVFNNAPIANWNVRAQLTTRSPSSQVGNKWYMSGAGSWLLQFVPHSPQDVNDQPSLSVSGSLVKNPFGSTVTFPYSPNVILFDLPNEGYGVLSIAKLRNALISPYSWNPSYIVGHSLRDLHAPSDATAHEIATNGTDSDLSKFDTRWDFLIGAARMTGISHGNYSADARSDGLLQIGSQAVQKNIFGNQFSSEDELLAYDIAFEVNQNLWDNFFISGMPLNGNTDAFDWEPKAGKNILNTRYQYNTNSSVSFEDVKTQMSGASVLEQGFFRNAEILKNAAAFNVNSTSVDAWTAFLSSNIGEKRQLKSGELDDNIISYSRFNKPFAAATTADADLADAGAWQGARQLSYDEVRFLAENIVAEVKKRGPFISLADFVNRRLAASTNDTSHMGTLDAAIKLTGLNRNFELDTRFQTTSENASNGSDAPDNNLDDFIDGYRYVDDGNFTTTQPSSQAWGMPGFLTQGDLLEPLAPAMTVRGDTFTIRTYGESSENGQVKARAWLETIVERTPDYLEKMPFDAIAGSGNKAIDSAQQQSYTTGQYKDGGLSLINKKFGRKFVIKSIRWLSPSEI